MLTFSPLLNLKLRPSITDLPRGLSGGIEVSFRMSLSPNCCCCLATSARSSGIPTLSGLRTATSIGASGFEYDQWVLDCIEFGDCGICRVNGFCPAEGQSIQRGRGSNFCGDQAKNLCIMGPYQVPQGASEGTSLATAYIGGVIWAVAYFIRHYPEYRWQEPLTDLQAAVTSVAIVKSCTVDMGNPGPDPEHGLGRLSLECLNRYDDDGNHIGFIDNPLVCDKREAIP